MEIIIDSRESAPLVFKNDYIDKVSVRKLDVGDYSCVFKDGYQVPIFFERKSIGDLFSTMGMGYKRFKREMLRAHNSNKTLILIVEGSLHDVFAGYEYSTIEGLSMVRKLFTLWVKHGLIPVFCNSRREMSEYITQFYIAAGKEYVRRKKEEGAVEQLPS